jgi:hypothetical protein
MTPLEFEAIADVCGRAPGAAHATTLANALVTQAAPKVMRLDRFMAVLGADDAADATIRALPAALRGEPLLALARRILLLPHREQAPATAALRAVAGGMTGPRPALLNELLQAAAPGGEGLEHRELALVRGSGAAIAAVATGRNLNDVAWEHGICAPNSIQQLQWNAAHGPGVRLVREAGHAQNVIQQLGITRPDMVLMLESRLVYSLGTAAIRRRERVQDIARRLGICSWKSLQNLEYAAVYGPAVNAVLMGEGVQSVVDTWGITNPALIAELEEVAAMKRKAHAASERQAALPVRAAPVPKPVPQSPHWSPYSDALRAVVAAPAGTLHAAAQGGR